MNWLACRKGGMGLKGMRLIAELLLLLVRLKAHGRNRRKLRL
jgi:hypothetical protein